jgi:uncharacterized membrane protein YedE/YeeE
MINIIKFAHILVALGLLGLTSYCMTLTSAKQRTRLIFFNKSLLIISFFALLTGSLLVYPKHYTFHTPWIQAAYLLVIIYAMVVGFSIRFSKRIAQAWIWRCVYGALIFILILIIHDAVTKHTVITLL